MKRPQKLNFVDWFERECNRLHARVAIMQMRGEVIDDKFLTALRAMRMQVIRQNFADGRC